MCFLTTTGTRPTTRRLWINFVNTSRLAISRFISLCKSGTSGFAIESAVCMSPTSPFAESYRQVCLGT